MVLEITNLPQEVLGLIFRRLPRDHHRIALVCRFFHQVIRYQSKPNDTLRLERYDPEACPIRIFENAGIFPFSKLHIRNGAQSPTVNGDFWQKNGKEINEIILEDNATSIQSFFRNWAAYFPNLETLSVLGAKPDGEQVKNANLPIESLTVKAAELDLESILFLLRSSPKLKHVWLKVDKSELLSALCAQFESIDSVQLSVEQIPLKELAELPSKIVFKELFIHAEDESKDIKRFFDSPRVIETLALRWHKEGEEFSWKNFTQEQVSALTQVKEVKNLRLCSGPPDFPRSLDLLVQLLPGLETISICTDYPRDYGNNTWPETHTYYWNNPETAAKIHEAWNKDELRLDCLTGLTNLESLSIAWPDPDAYDYGNVLYGEEIQEIIRNCPNLKRLDLFRINALDEHLIGNENMLPFNTLNKLEVLLLHRAPEITVEAFEKAFKFPNLRQFLISSRKIDNDAVKFLVQNCPNIEDLTLHYSKIDNSGFECLIRGLLYLRKINIGGELHTVSDAKVQEVKREFSYIKMNVTRFTDDDMEYSDHDDPEW